jgi:hypothetical protein
MMRPSAQYGSWGSTQIVHMSGSRPPSNQP